MKIQLKQDKAHIRLLHLKIHTIFQIQFNDNDRTSMKNNLPMSI